MRLLVCLLARLASHVKNKTCVKHENNIILLIWIPKFEIALEWKLSVYRCKDQNITGDPYD
jgi:hypothetical protein